MTLDSVRLTNLQRFVDKLRINILLPICYYS
jgi:hypothetical protein